MDYAVRFIAGGPDCFRFAILGGVLRPNSFAGLFSAAPSVALVTLTLALIKQGPQLCQSRRAVDGARRRGPRSLQLRRLPIIDAFSLVGATSVALILWMAVALGAQQLLSFEE